jgi:putative protease
MEKAIGRITHYFGHVGAAGVALQEPLRVGDKLHVVGHTTDLTMTVERMQIDHKDVAEAKPGDDVAVHMPERVREHDEVRKVVGD